MQCLPYAKQRWGELTTKTWAGSGNDGPAVYNNWTSTRKGANISSSNLPAIAIYTGGTYGHTGIIESYNSSTKTYRYTDHNGKNADALYSADLTADGIKTLFNTRTWKGCCW